ncbi:hypothetical protein WICMUC_001215 [Wickerhamomyces mucosus]|uniref:Nuclear polyadenylated RNA-binding protein NAB2 n=1 Tax=Wickerhamomyces mucosus TaxID=1378264 RepID=A0A9P8PWU6_9ASCO|nr:hypothetical protein WICMUC_001215 [Wickerhamomyces mucosus]
MSTITEELKNELKNFVSQQLQQVSDFNEDIESTADYIVLLIANGRSADDTYNEVNDLFGNPALKDVIGRTYQALTDYQTQSSTQNQPQETQEQTPQQQLPEQPEQPQPQGQANDQDLTALIPNHSATLNSGRTIPSRPNNGKFNNRNGISKGLPNGPKSFAMKNSNAFQKALNLSNGGQLRKKSRCHKFPHCPNKDCNYAHPTKPCFNFPNCPNPPGTCNYLHPGEDDALIAELEKTRAEYQEKKAQNQLKRNQIQSGITLCKFGNVCTNQQCPFGHPTPANEDAKVIRLEWCEENLKCSNESCPKAHSSLSKIKEVKPLQSIINTNFNQPAAEKSLDPCKFGSSCTNRYCKFRHATSHVLCRDGENCIRIDCFFSHPINEDCRFGEGCKNAKCLFKHPNGKSPAVDSIPNKGSLTWTNNTNERQFAVPENQIIEQAPAQEG